jgi:rhodanese-related sulfurtransferase
MNQLLVFIQNHPFLLTGIVAMAAIAITFELRHRRNTSTAVSPGDAVRLMNGGALVLDIRPTEAFATGHIIDARNVPADNIASESNSLKKYREKPVIVCCDSGATSAGAANSLKAQGFTKVVNLRGGLAAWKQENLPLVTADAVKQGGKKRSKS